ncbi:MAG: aldo/keto reductase [Cyclobacteriaceae bacterium]|nr:aldo/keto reductase [Cyclobacteriaceae bacterium]
MKYSELGTTGIEVSKICLGTMTWGEQNDEKEGHEQLNYALDHGINFIDTAELYSIPPRKATYGSTETIIGTWIKKRQRRDDFILASKIAGPREGLEYIRENGQFSKPQIIEALDGSLKRLQTDYIDLYQLHWPVRKTNCFGLLGYPLSGDDEWNDNFIEVLQTLDEMVKVGKIRYFGVSNETPWGVMHLTRIAEKYGFPKIQSIQNPYNLLNRTYEVGLSEISIREQMGLLAYSPLAFGLLSGKYFDNSAASDSRINQFPELSRYNNTLSQEAARQYVQLAKENNISGTQLALAFINQQNFVTSNIIGATTMEQLKENINSIKIVLDESIIEKINTIHQNIPNPAP